MGKLDEKNHFIATNESVMRMLNAYGFVDVTYEELKNGLENTTLLIKNGEDRYVLRVYRKNKKSNESIMLEIEFQKYLQQHGFPVPKLLPNSDGEYLTIVSIDETDWQSVLMEYMGQTDFMSYTDSLLKNLANTQARMHIAGIDFSRSRRSHKTYTELKETIMHEHPPKNLDGNQSRFIEQAKKFYLPFSKTLPFGYNHLDFDTHGNVLVKNNKVLAILDFDDLFYSPSVLCLGYTLWHVLFETNHIEKVHFYLAEYEKTRVLTTEELQILPQVILFRNYVIGVIELGVRKNVKHIEHIMNLENMIKHLTFVK